MKTTHEKLLISLLALGLTSSAGLYAQTAATLNNFDAANNFTTALQGGGLVISSLINEDLDLDGNFDIGEDANNDGLLNNGGTGPNDINGNPTFVGIEGALLNEFIDQVDYDGDGFIQNTAALGLANLFNEDLDGDNILDRNEDLDGDGRLDNVNEDINNNNALDVALNEDINLDGILDPAEDLNGDGILNNGGTGPNDANGNPTLLAGEGAFINEDLDGDANLDLGIEDIDGDGVLDATDEDFRVNQTFERHEDLDGDGNFDNVNEDLNGNNGLDVALNEDADLDGVLDQGEDLNGDGILNNGGTGPNDANGNPTLLAGEGALINEDLDNDGRLDLGTEDANGNGVFDTNRNVTLMEAVNTVTGNRQDLDILVANDVFINGQAVATENYVDAQDNVLRGEFAAADALLQAQITTNAGDIFTNSRGIAKNRRDIESNTRGIAMVAALQNQTVLPGMTQALDLSAAHFEGETGMAINYSRRINENVQINFGAATTSDGDENVVKAGIGWQW